MQRKLDHDAKLQEFFGVKGNRRVNVDLEMREANRKLMQQEQVERQLNDLESILDDIKVSGVGLSMSNIRIRIRAKWTGPALQPLLYKLFG